MHKKEEGALPEGQEEVQIKKKENGDRVRILLINIQWLYCLSSQPLQREEGPGCRKRDWAGTQAISEGGEEA